MEKRRAIVLAAGKGKRLQSEASDLPKVLRKVADKALLGYVLEKLDFLPSSEVAVVIGYEGQKVKAYAGEAYNYFWQTEQLGTGHATAMALDFFKDFDGLVLLCYGDMPLIAKETYEGLFRTCEAEGASACILAYDTDLKLPYGRIIRDSNGNFKEVVEDRDCSPDQRQIKELNAGVYVFRSEALVSALKKLKNNNSQAEYYLTDVPAHIIEAGGKVVIYQTRGRYEAYGVNTQEDLDLVQQIIAK